MLKIKKNRTKVSMQTIRSELLLAKMRMQGSASLVCKNILDIEREHKKSILSKYFLFPNTYLRFPKLTPISPFVNLYSCVANMKDRGLANVMYFLHTYPFTDVGRDITFGLSFLFAGLVVAQMPLSLLEVEPTLMLDLPRLEILQKVILHKGSGAMGCETSVASETSEALRSEISALRSECSVSVASVASELLAENEICTCRSNPVHNRILSEFHDKSMRLTDAERSMNRYTAFMIVAITMTTSFAAKYYSVSN